MVHPGDGTPDWHLDPLGAMRYVGHLPLAAKYTILGRLEENALNGSITMDFYNTMVDILGIGERMTDIVYNPPVVEEAIEYVPRITGDLFKLWVDFANETGIWPYSRGMRFIELDEDYQHRVVDELSRYATYNRRFDAWIKGKVVEPTEPTNIFAQGGYIGPHDSYTIDPSRTFAWEFGVKKDKNDAYFLDPGNPRKSKKSQRPRKESRVNTRPQKKLQKQKTVNRQSALASKAVVTRAMVMTRRPALALKQGSLGNGDYVPVQAPANVLKMSQGDITASGNGIRLRRKEKLVDIVGTAAATVALLPWSGSFNPGFTTWWLSHFGKLYETYVVKHMAFTYIPIVSFTSAGRVVMAFDYDSLDVNSTVQELQSMQPSISFPPTLQTSLVLDAEGLGKVSPRWIRQAKPLAATDTNAFWYDLGRLWVGTTGCSTTTVNGEIWIEYDIEMQTPHIFTEPAANTCDKAVTTTCNRTHIWLGYTWTSTGSDFSYTGITVNAGGNAMYFPSSGQWLMIIAATGTVFLDAAPVFSTMLGCVATNLDRVVELTGALRAIYIISVDVYTPDAALIIDLTTCCSTCTATDTRLSQYLTALARPVGLPEYRLEIEDPKPVVLQPPSESMEDLDGDEDSEHYLEIKQPQGNERWKRR